MLAMKCVRYTVRFRTVLLHRRDDDPVRKRHAAKRQRAEQVREWFDHPAKPMRSRTHAQAMPSAKAGRRSWCQWIGARGVAGSGGASPPKAFAASQPPITVAIATPRPL